MTPKKIEEMFERFKKANPDPRSELQFNNPYELLVAVMLSAQATDISVNKATDKLYPVANTPESIIGTGCRRIKVLRQDDQPVSDQVEKHHPNVGNIAGKTQW